MFRLIGLDFTGFMASMICAVHCSVVPILVSMGVLGAGHWLENGLIDFAIVILGLVVAFVSLMKEYKKHHSLQPIMIASFGFLMLGYGLVQHSQGSHSILSVIGGVTLAIAHIVNWRMVKITCER